MEFVIDSKQFDSPFIKTIWHTYSDTAGTFISQSTVTWEIVVWRHKGETHVTVRGPETTALMTASPADAEFFGVRFTIGTYMPLLPIRRLVDGQITLPGAGKNSFWLHGAAWELPTFDNADVFVDRLVREGLLIRDPVVETVIEHRPLNISPRSLQYHFLQATGLTRSTFRQIQRAREAYAMLQRGESILNTVYENGYFDQSHMTRSLKRFMGQTPSQVSPLRIEG